MKRLVFLLTIISLMLVACSKDSEPILGSNDPVVDCLEISIGTWTMSESFGWVYWQLPTDHAGYDCSYPPGRAQMKFQNSYLILTLSQNGRYQLDYVFYFNSDPMQRDCNGESYSLESPIQSDTLKRSDYGTFERHCYGLTKNEISFHSHFGKEFKAISVFVLSTLFSKYPELRMEIVGLEEVNLSLKLRPTD